MKTNQKNHLAIDEHAQRVNDMRRVMDTDHGRRIMHWIISEGRIFRSCFTGNSTTFYNEGARELALKVFTAVLEAGPEVFYKSHAEILRREAEYAERKRRVAADTDEH